MHSSLAVGRRRACSSVSPRGGEAQEAAVLAQRLEQVGALAGEVVGRSWVGPLVVVCHELHARDHSGQFLSSIARIWTHGRARAPGCCGCCPCCRRTGTGRAASWPTGSRCRCARCAATSTGCASSATRCRRSAASTAATSWRPGAAMPPLVLDDDEAVAIALGLQAAAHGAVAGIAEASVSALAKIVQVMPPRLRRRVDALRAATRPTPWRPGGAVEQVDPGALTTVAQACRDTDRLRFAYTAADGERTEREVEPLRLVALGRRWYLVAYDLDRHDWRSFRLDRLERPVAGRRPVPAPGAAGRRPGRFVRERVTAPPAVFEVVARVQAPADAVRGRIGAWSSVGAGRRRSRRRLRRPDDRRPAAVAGARAVDARRRVHRARTARAARAPRRAGCAVHPGGPIARRPSGGANGRARRGRPSWSRPRGSAPPNRPSAASTG